MNDASKASNLLKAERSEVLSASIHAVAAIVLHVTGDRYLPRSQRAAYVKQLQLLLEAEASNVP